VSAVLAASSLSIGADAGPQGDNVLLPILFQNDDQSVALQFDFQFDTNQVTCGEVLAGGALNTHELYVSEPTGGVCRVLLFSRQNEDLPDGNVATLEVEIQPGATNGNVEVKLEGEVIGDTQATPVVPASTSDGAIGVDSALEDGDKNGLPDAWELQHFSQTGVSLTLDSDEDGMSNWAEFRAGTDPNDPEDVFVLALDDVADALQLRWPSAEYRTYTVYFSTNLVMESILETGIRGSPPTNSRTYSTQGRGFFRVGID